MDVQLAFPLCFCLHFLLLSRDFWQSLMGVCTLNSRQKNHWEKQHCLVCCFPLNQQLAVQLVLSFQDCYWSVKDKHKSFGCISVLFCVIFCCISSLRPFRIIWMELGKKGCLQMVFFCLVIKILICKTEMVLKEHSYSHQ